MPAYNEASNIAFVVRELEATLAELDTPYRLLVVDDGSEDTTSGEALRASRDGRVEVLRHQANRGLGTALRSGLLDAVEASEVIVTMDADRSHDPSVIPRMVEKIRDGRDIVVASRFAKGSEARGVPLHRRILSRAATALLQFVSPVSGVRDYSSGFRAYRSGMLQHGFRAYGEEGLVKEEGFACTVELLLKLAALGATVEEVPLRLRYDEKKGASKMDVPSTIRGYAEVLKFRDEWPPPFDREETRRMLWHADPGLREDRLCRILNVGLAAIVLVAAAPLMALIAVLVKLTSQGPVFYTQTRIGLDRRREIGTDEGDPRRRVDYTGKPFTIHKFRTMYVQEDGDEPQVWASPDDPRITPLGRVLRKFRLDELPQLVNVLQGDMNVVGPRPEQPEIALRLKDEVDGYRYRHRVPPGITGWAQVNYTYDRSVDDVRNKLQYDLEYIYRRSVARDLEIAVRTIPVVLTQRGAW